MTVTVKTYANCPRKHAARDSTIIQPYRKVFGQSLPPDKQYWSMCAKCADINGIIEDSELDQIVKAGLIKPEQFHGVDIEEEIHKSNCLYQESNWYNEDFLTAMKYAQREGVLNPALINADLINMREKAAIQAGHILNFLYDYGHLNTMVVLNVVLKAHNRFSSMQDLVKSLCQDSGFRIVWNKGNWKVFENLGYRYNGTQPNKKMNSDVSNPKTIMGTIIFVPNREQA